MEYLIIICTTIIILFFMYLYSQAKDKYVDEPVKSGDILNSKGRRTGEWVRYKRTHKNGKVTYHEVNYK